MSSNIAAFERKNLADEVAGHLAAEIISGALDPDTPLREQSLVNQLGVSRGTLREALLILERQYLAVLSPRKGARVAPLDWRWIAEICEVWYALFEVLLRHVAERADDTQRAQLGAAVAQLESAEGDPVMFVDQAMELVNRVCSMHREGVLTHQLGNLIPAARRCFHFAVMGDAEEIQDARRFAAAMLRAAINGDAALVRERVTEFSARQMLRMRRLVG